MNDAPDASQSRISCPGLEQSSDFYQVFLKYFSDAESFNPTRSALLRKFGLALQIERCQGLYLYSPSGLRYLDFLSQYGVLPFGHNHPEIVDAVKDYLNRSRPIMLQPSTPPSVERLADTLQRLAPGKLRFCVFGSSGAEAVEIAVKAARAATGKQTILSTRTGFHGKTLAALSATGRSLYQRPFGGPAPGFEHIAFADPDRLEHYLRRHARETAAFIVEPIQAEGGMIVPGSDYLERVGGACRRNGVLFIADEIQTGLGRTGSLFATLPSASPDILLLSKALGGGIMPISVCMISEAAWTPQIGYLHSSTFANNGLACCVASKVIDMLVRKGEKTINQVRSSGARLLAELQGIQRKYPDVVKDVRGQGLLTGIEFRPFDRGDSAAVAMCAHSECMMGLLSGYLLNEHRLVTAPVFSHSRVLRLQPPLTVSEQQIGKAVDALDSLCENLHKGRYSRLFSYLVRKPSDSPTTSPPRSTGPKAGFRSATAPGGQKGGFAFLIHPSSTEDFLRGDPSFREFSAEELANWHKWAVGMPPSIAHRIPKVESPMGVQTSGWFIGIPLLPKDFYRIGRVAAIGLVEDAIRVAWHLGASVVGLGGYSSIVTRAGLEVTGHGVAVTSGNSLTAVAALRALQRRCRGKRPLSSRSVAVLGAAGSVGRLTATLLAPHVR
ncbi:MAG TPA: aminotransferase class III-fold pyridoxal phosphate-dependent enzyme, partial [Acidobacteriota bacterium]|nr:aminotransferase class III-fold pyridoxal phosphate-dependent enzyme [Acidobacteriota bacterium]